MAIGTTLNDHVKNVILLILLCRDFVDEIALEV